MRDINMKLINAIQNESPFEEIEKLINKGADVNTKIDYIYYDDPFGAMKEEIKKISLSQYILEELNENIIEYQSKKIYIKEASNINDENSLDIIIYFELEKFLKKSIYFMKILDLIVKNKNFIAGEKFLISLMNSPVSELLRPLINTLILKLDVVKKKEIIIVLIQNKIDYKYIELTIEAGVDINFVDEYGLTPLIYAFAYDETETILLLKKYDNLNKEIHEKSIKEFLYNILNGKLLPTFLLKSSNSIDISKFILHLISNANVYGLNLENILNDKFINLFIELKLLYELINKNIFKVDEKIENKTLLEFALQKQDYKLTKFLIKKGANVNFIFNNKSLLEFAQFIQDKELENLIKSSPTYQPLEHNPKRLVEILTNFRKDSPIKYTTHLWDFNFNKEYGNFENYIKAVKNQWNEMEKKLKKLSPNMHKKIELFLFAKDEKEAWSSVEGDKLAIGWSNLKGLDKWCNRGKNAFNFELNRIYKVKGKTISKFEDVVSVFKREIQIRNENNHLESIISEFEEKIFEKDENFEIEYEKLRGKSFYTDVEAFKRVLDKIFVEMLKRKKYPKIIIETKNDNEDYFDLTITQIGSFSEQFPEDMLKKAEGGDFGDIKKNLKNLCDWSIEDRTADNKSYRLNYLISKPIERIEYLDEDIKGFTHILRFYK